MEELRCLEKAGPLPLEGSIGFSLEAFLSDLCTYLDSRPVALLLSPGQAHRHEGL